MSGYVELQVTTNHSFVRDASDVEEMFVAASSAFQDLPSGLVEQLSQQAGALNA